MTRRALALALCVPALLCAAWTVFAGKDLNWDLLNYHYYAPFQLLEGRLQQDFFAASAQGYLNPLGYLPFYLLASGAHSVLASALLALLHSVAIALLYFTAWRLFAHLEPRRRTGAAILAAALGAASGVFWTMVGTSFLDVLLLPLVLGGVLLLIDARRFMAAGALFGIAAALKYSNALFAVAALPLVLAAGWRPLLAYAAGGAAALALFAGPWLVLMWREFGNPVFPLFNAWFQSPHALAINQVGNRFTPADLTALLAFPFRMVALDRSLYAETFAPDLRPAALVLAALAVALLARRRPAAALAAPDWRLIVFAGLAWLLWLLSSGNARYGLAVLMLAGVLLARLTERAFGLRAAAATLGALLAVQLAMLALASPARWFIAEPWSRHWLPYVAPARALEAPALYLTLETLPMAAVAPFVHPASSFVNFRGQHSVPPDAPRLAALLERHRGRERALGRTLEPVGGAPAPAALRDYDRTLERIGFHIDPSDCFTIEWRRDDADALSRLANALSGTAPASETLSLASCGLRRVPRDPESAAAERRAGAIFDRAEKACPALFRGQTAVTEPFGVKGWSRNYPGLDARLETVGDLLVLNRYRAGRLLALGRLADWERPEAPPCRQP
jgi:hypothetical protein